MKRKMSLVMGILFLVVMMMSGVVLSAEPQKQGMPQGQEMTIDGHVDNMNNTFTDAASGSVYEIANTPEGEQLISAGTEEGILFEVKGTVMEESGGKKTINIQSFKILEGK